MTDFTTTNLEAALLDQKVAGLFAGKRYAFVSVLDDGGKWALGIAVLDEAGYDPITGKTFATQAEAREWSEGLNKHIGLGPRDVLDIVASTMRPARFPRRVKAAQS